MMRWRRFRTRPRTDIEADTRLAETVRDEIIEERSSLTGDIVSLLSRKDYNGFGEDLQVTFTPSSRRPVSGPSNPRHI